MQKPKDLVFRHFSVCACVCVRVSACGCFVYGCLGVGICVWASAWAVWGAWDVGRCGAWGDLGWNGLVRDGAGRGMGRHRVGWVVIGGGARVAWGLGI